MKFHFVLRFVDKASDVWNWELCIPFRYTQVYKVMSAYSQLGCFGSHSDVPQEKPPGRFGMFSSQVNFRKRFKSLSSAVNELRSAPTSFNPHPGTHWSH